MNQNENSIDSSIFIFDYESKSMASQCSNVIETVFKTQIASQLEGVITSKIANDIIVHLDSLVIDIGVIQEDKLENDLALRVRDAFDKVLEENLSINQTNSNDFNPSKKNSSNNYLLDALELFLVRGYFPKWIEPNQTLNKLLLSLNDNSKEELNKLIRKYRFNENVIKRISYNIEPDTFEILLEVLEPVNQKWIRVFISKLLSLTKFELNYTNSSLKELNLIILKYLLNDRFDSFKKSDFSNQVLKLFLIQASIEPWKILEEINLSKDKESIDYVFIKSLDKINEGKNSTDDIEFIKLIYAFNNSEIGFYSNLDLKRFLDFIKKTETRELLINRLNLSGLNNIFQFFFKKDGDRLNSIFVSFFNFIDQIENSEIKNHLPSSINEVALASLLFFENKSLQNVDFEEYFLFLCSIQGIDNKEFNQNSVTQEFISNQKDLDGIKISRLLRDTITKNEINRSVQNVNKTLYNSKHFKNREFSASKSPYDAIDKFRIKIIKFYLSFGHLPDGFQDLNLYDLQNIFNDLLEQKNSFLSNIILLESISSELLIHRIQLLLTETNSSFFDSYVLHYFTSTYDYVEEILVEFEYKLNINYDIKLAIGLFRNKIILNSLVYSKGKYKPYLVLSFINLGFEEILPKDIFSSEPYISFLNEMKKIIGDFEEKESIITDKVQFVKKDIKPITSKNIQLHYIVTIIQFYALNQLLPWWSEEKSLDDFFDVLQNQMNSFQSIFEEVFLDKEVEGKFLAYLANALPNEFIIKLSNIFQPFQQLNNKWKEILNNRNKQSHINSLFQLTVSDTKSPPFSKQNIDNNISLLNDKVISDSNGFNKEELKTHIEFYLRLTPYYYFNYLTPQIWAQSIFSFAIEYGNNLEINKNQNINESFIVYLNKKYQNIQWDQFFILVFDRFQIPSISNRNDNNLKISSNILNKHRQNQLSSLKDVEMDFIKVLNKSDFVQNSPVYEKISSHYDVSYHLFQNFYALQFYAKHEFLPWWSNETSIEKYFISLFKLSVSLKNIFQEAILQIEIEDQFLAILAASLPKKYIKELTNIFRSHQKLNSIWKEILSKLYSEYLDNDQFLLTSEVSQLSLLKANDSLIGDPQNQVGAENDNSINEHPLKDGKIYLEQKDISNLQHKLSVLQFYGRHQILPSWSNETSIDKLLITLSDISVSAKSLFEDVVLQIETKDHLLTSLGASLPKKYIQELTNIFRPHVNLNSKWNEILSKHSLENLSIEPILPSSKDVEVDPSKVNESLISEDENHIGKNNEIKKGIEEDYLNDGNSLLTKGNSSYLFNKSRLLHTLSVLQFYASNKFLPWWSDESSLSQLFRLFEIQSPLFEHIFEEVFLEKEVEEQLLEKLSVSLPEEFLKRFTKILKPYEHLSNRWEECLIMRNMNDDSKKLKKKNQGNKQRGLSKLIEQTDVESQDFHLLKKNIYFLKDKEILKSAVFNKGVLKDQLHIYLGLAPYFFFRNLTPQKWREYVYSFALWYGNNSEMNSNTNFHESLFSFLESEYRSIQWNKVFIQVLKKVQGSSSFRKEDYPSELLTLIDISENRDKKEFQKQMEQFNSTDKEIPAVEIRILNAGVIIIWPFLTRLFEQLGLVSNGEFIDLSKKNRAIYLLQFLAYNHIDYPEYELVLNKILVGMPMQNHIKPIEQLTLEETNMARSLMNGLILNWEKVKNSSVEGIQETFFQREGILSFNHDYNKLMIPKKGVDVLVESIPWNLSLIKLSWMEKPLHIEWI